MEQAQICRDSVGIISRKTILKNHPFVEDAEAELKQLEKEEKEQQEKENEYLQAFHADSEKEEEIEGKEGGSAKSNLDNKGDLD